MLLRTLALCLLCCGSLLSLAQSEKNDSLEFITYYYEGGARSSEGHLRQGRPDGYWKSYYRNGNLKAEGNRKNFLLEGPWLFYDQEGNKTVEINYGEDKKNGLRKTFSEGKVVKEETFVNDKLQGFSREYFPTGELEREVPFVDGLEKGEGYEYEKDGRIVTLLTYKAGVLTKKQRINRLDEQAQKQGLWISFFKNRKIESEGPYVNGLKNGYWKYYQANGSLKRVEKWVMGVLQENAQEVAKIKIKREINPKTGKLAFKGAYRNGKPEGVHRKYDDEGNVVESRIYENGILLFEGIVDEQGRRQGPWKEYYPTGELKSEGSYKDNIKIQKWVYYYIDGDVEQTGNYLRGMPDGLWSWYYPNEQLWREEEYVSGREDGASIEYSDSGAVIAKGTYIDGFKDGEWYFEINDHREEGKYFEGERTGEWKHYYLDNDQLSFEGSYENGLASGMHVYYYPSGQIKMRGPYSIGVRDGVWEYFTEGGVRIITIEYDDGQEVKYNGEKIRYGKRYEKLMEREAQEESEENL